MKLAIALVAALVVCGCHVTLDLGDNQYIGGAGGATGDGGDGGDGADGGEHPGACEPLFASEDEPPTCALEATCSTVSDSFADKDVTKTGWTYRYFDGEVGSQVSWCDGGELVLTPDDAGSWPDDIPAGSLFVPASTGDLLVAVRGYLTNADDALPRADLNWSFMGIAAQSPDGMTLFAFGMGVTSGGGYGYELFAKDTSCDVKEPLGMNVERLDGVIAACRKDGEWHFYYRPEGAPTATRVGSCAVLPGAASVGFTVNRNVESPVVEGHFQDAFVRATDNINCEEMIANFPAAGE